MYKNRPVQASQSKIVNLVCSDIMCICKFAVFLICNTASLNPVAAPECPVVYAGNNIQRKWLVQYQPYIYYTNTDENTNGIQKQITEKSACLKVYLPQQHKCKDNACVTCVKWTIEVAYKQHLLMTLDLDILSPFNIVYTLYSCDFDFCYKLCVFKTLSKSLKRSKQRTSFLPALHVQSKNFPYFTNNLWCMDSSRTIWHPDNLAPDSFSLWQLKPIIWHQEGKRTIWHHDKKMHNLAPIKWNRHFGTKQITQKSICIGCIKCVVFNECIILTDQMFSLSRISQHLTSWDNNTSYLSILEHHLII